MQRTNIIQLRPNKIQKKILKELLLLSSCVYNEANYLVRQQFFNKEKVSSFYDLQQQLQNTDNYQQLGRSYALPRLQIYAETNSARFKLIKSRTQKHINLPKYYKNRKTKTTVPSYLVFDGCQFSVKQDHVYIPLSRRIRKQYKMGKHFKIKYNGVLNWKGKQRRGQIKFKDGHFYLHQSVELKDKPKKKGKVKAGLDLGIKKLFALHISTGEDKIIGNKRFLKQWKYWTNLIAKEKSLLANQNRKTSKNLQKLYKKRSKWQNNLYNNLTANLFKTLVKNNVDTLVIGDIKNIRKSRSKGRIVNQMINNYWSFGLLLKKIENKAEEFGIELIKQKEDYTSRTCPICGDNSKLNCKDRVFICSFCDYVNHRDLVGATNILQRSMYGSIESIHWGEMAPLALEVAH